MATPNFLCIGAQKAGTTWLFVNLAQNPSVWMPPVKELHYFDHLFVPENRSWTQWHIQTSASRSLKWHVENVDRIDFSYVKYLCDLASTDLFTEGWYRRAFDRPGAKGKLLGDVTPEYSTLPEQGIAYVRQLLGKVKIIYIIRHPVERALSQIRMNWQRRNIMEPTEEDWQNAIENWDVLNRGDFKAYVPRWKSAFAENDILFLNYAKVTTQPREVMTEVEKFLGIDHFADYGKLDQAIHQSRKVPIPPHIQARLQEILRSQVDFVRDTFGAEFLG